jgi:hypothetical protein
VNAMMKQTVHVAHATGRTAAGELTYGPPQAIRARVELLSRNLSTATGQRVTTTHRLYTTSVVAETTRIWLPGAPPSQVEGSKVPVAVASHPRPAGGETLYEVDL